MKSQMSSELVGKSPFVFKPVDDGLITELFLNVKIKRSFGFDVFSNRRLSNVHEDMKQTKVIPPEKANRIEFNNHRSISLLTFFSKFGENVINSHVSL